MRRVAAAGALLAVLMVVPSARAAKPAQQGWWEGASPLQPITDLLASLGLDLGGVNAVDVPPDGLLVQGGTSEGQPAAYAALAFAVGSDDIAGPLRLVPAPAAASVPGSKVKACPLDNPSFKPAQGGAPATAPGYDCLGAVATTVADDGAYVVDVTTLRRDDRVAVAILPAATSTRVVFQAPDDDALPLRPVSAPVVGAGAVPVDQRVDESVSKVPTPGVNNASAVGNAVLGGEPASSEPASAEPASGAVAALPSSSSRPDRPVARVLVLGLLGVIAVALWFVAGRLGRARA